MAGVLPSEIVSASEIQDFEADANWFLARAWRGVFAVAGVIVGIFIIFNQLSKIFDNGVEFVLLGRQVVFPPMEFRTHVSADWVVPIIILSCLIVLNRWMAFKFIKQENTFLEKKKVFHRFVYLGEILAVFAMKYSGGVESPMFLYFLGHTVALSSVVSRRSLARHIVFLCILFSFVSVSEFTGFIAHTHLTSPPMDLYKSGPYVLMLTLGVMGYMGYIGVSSSNIFRKLEERKRAIDQADRSGREAQLYLDIMGHDFSNHSQVVMGNLGLIDKASENGNVKKYVKKCKRQLQKCDRLVSRTGIFAAISEIGPEDLKSVELNKCLEQSIAIVKEEYPGLLKCYFRRDVLKYTKGNNLLKTVFVSVLENAVEHSNGDSAKVKVFLEETHDNYGEYWLIRMEDKGSGIPDEMKSKIFNRFSRIGIEKGSGLSLSLARAILDKYGGRIEVTDRVEGSPSQGAAFFITLPKA